MKSLTELFRLFLLAVAFTASAVEFSVEPQSPWQPNGKNAYSIEFGGGKVHPYLWIRSKELKNGAYYRLSFEAAEGRLFFAALIREKSGEKWSHRGYHDDLENHGGTKHYSFYFRARKPEEGSAFAIYPLQGKKGKDTIRNISLEEVTDFSDNLLKEGDFEFGSALFPRHERFAGQLAVVASPGFFCGEESLRIIKKAGDTVAAISRDLPAIPGRTVTVSFWVRAERGTIPGIMYLDFFRPGREKHLVRKFGFKAEPDWKKFSYSYQVPEDTALYPALVDGMLRVHFHLSKSEPEATVWLDNLEYTVQ
ncbi:hypothetical protein [Victivallis vadensis]|uniref:hypothetical protein n=1 Tax=Victivallis vadensis TaxID=172901 RepID=UPI003AF982C2